MTESKRSKLEKEVVKLERQIEAQQKKVDGLLATDNFDKAEREQGKLSDLSIQADLKRRRVNQLVAEESDEKERQRKATIDALTAEMVTLEGVMKAGNDAGIAVWGFWQALADRNGKGAGADPRAWAQSREDALLPDLQELVKEITPKLAPVDLKDADSLEGRYRAAQIERNELMEGRS